jgi:hypothetical protein
MAKLRFEIEGTPGDVQFMTYMHALWHAMSVLRELDSALSGKYHGSINWYVAHQASSDTLAIDLRSRQKPIKAKKQESIPADVGPRVASSFVTGFENLERGVSPPYISEFGLIRIKDMMDELRKNGARGYRVTDLDEARSIRVSEKTGETVRQLLPADKHAIGSVEGTLETISVHKQRKFIVYHALTNKAVTCRIGDDEDMLRTAINALGERVVAIGTVQFNAKGETVRVRADDIRLLGKGTLPTTRELAGSDPDFTDGMSSVEVIRSFRE